MNIRLSINRKNAVESKTDGNKVTRFQLETADLTNQAETEEIFRKYVHATNVWDADQNCSKDSYQGMVGLGLDADDGLITIEAAQEQFKDYNYILYTTTSHLVDKPNHYGAQHRFRVILPFEPSDELYFSDPDEADAVFAWAKKTFPQFDPGVFARHMKLLPNLNTDPDRFILHVNTDGKWFQVPMDEVQQLAKEKLANATGGKSDKDSKGYRYIKHDMDIVLPDRRTSFTLETLRPYLETCKDRKQPCFCPFCDDLNSESASARVKMTPNGFVDLYCSHCESVGEASGGQCLYHEDPIEPGLFMLEDRMMRVKLSPNNVHVGKICDDYIKKENREHVRTNLSRLRNITCAEFVIERQASASFTRSQYELDISKGCLRVQIPSAIDVDQRDNKFIDEWLDNLFGQYSDFIKNWLALYSYTNYQKLPVIVLTGPRAAGKTTFAEIVGEIFPDLSTDWIGDQAAFTPAFTKKLLMVDENHINKKSQYMQLKVLTGSTYLTVNEKYMPQYRVRNNTNIIMTTNEPRPMFLKSDEKPTDRDRNNFFIYQVPGINQVKPGIKNDILARLGNYIESELLQRYEKWEAQKDKSTARYGIPCPITDLANDLYESAQTNIEADAELIAEALVCGHDTAQEGLLGGGTHIKKMEFNKLVASLGLRGTSQQVYFSCLQDKGIVAYREKRSKNVRLGYEILRDKSFYGDNELTLMTGGASPF